jgi:hypothetical protein
MWVIRLEHKQAVRQHCATGAGGKLLATTDTRRRALFAVDGAYITRLAVPENPAGAVAEAAQRLLDGYCSA